MSSWRVKVGAEVFVGCEAGGSAKAAAVSEQQMRTTSAPRNRRVPNFPLPRCAGGGLGRGLVLEAINRAASAALFDPLPSPPPEYRRRGELRFPFISTS